MTEQTQADLTEKKTEPSYGDFAQLLKDAGLVFVSRSYGEYTTNTVSKDQLIDLMQKARKL